MVHIVKKAEMAVDERGRFYLGNASGTVWQLLDLASLGIAVLAHGSGNPHNGSNTTFDLVGGELFPWSGTFRISFHGQKTAPIDVANDTIAQIQAKLEALPAIGTGNLLLTGAGGEPGPMYPDNGGEIDGELIGELSNQELDLSSLIVTDLNVLVTSDQIPASPDNWMFDTSPGTEPVPSAEVNIYVDDDNGTIWINTAFGTESSPNWVKSNREDFLTEFIAQGGDLTDHLYGDGHSLFDFYDIAATDKVYVSGSDAMAEGNARLSKAGSTFGGHFAAGNADDTEDVLSVSRYGGSNYFRIKNDGKILLETLPTADPHVVGQLWNDAGTLKVSAG